VPAVERAAVALPAHLITFGFREALERRRMVAVAIEASAVGNGLVQIFAREAFRAMASITQVGRFSDEELLDLALMGGMTAVAHADLERPVLFPAHQLLVHMAFKTEPRGRFRKEVPGLCIVRFVARCTPSACNGLVAVLAAGEGFFTVAFIAEVRLLCQQELFGPGLVRAVAGHAIPLSNGFMNDAVRIQVLVVTLIAEFRRLRHEEVLCIL